MGRHERPGWAVLSLSLELQPLGSTSDMGQGRHQRTQPLHCTVLYSTVQYSTVGKVRYCSLHQPLKPLPAELGEASEAATSPGGSGKLRTGIFGVGLILRRSTL